MSLRNLPAFHRVVDPEEGMRRTLIAALVLLSGNWLWGDLQDRYKIGTIVLKGVDDFGGGKDWEGLFYDPYKDMVVAPDGSIFVVNTRAHDIYKFDKYGKFLKKFGRRGEGPGEHNTPLDPSILDGKYLVTGEYALNRRFTLWDLDGRYQRVVRTKTSVFYLTALRNSRVAYYTFNEHPTEANGYQRTVSIIIKDIMGGGEKIVKRIASLDRSMIRVGPSESMDIGNFFSQVYLAQTIDGDLAVGVSDQPRIEIYSPTGELTRTFDLKMAPLPADKKYIKEFKDIIMAELNAEDETALDRNEKYWHDKEVKTLRNFDFSAIFDSCLPLYRDILVDSEGNFLVFKFTPCQKDCHPSFQVYSKEGAFICETVLDRGTYGLEIDRRFRQLCFTADGIFGLFMERGDEDEILKLCKSDYLPAPQK